MKISRIAVLSTALVLGLAVMASSCATSVAVTVTRPAELDLRGAKAIAVLPFQYKNDSWTNLSFFDIMVGLRLGRIRDANTPEARLARSITDQLATGISGGSWFTMVDDKALSAYLDNPAGDPPAEVYLTGEITRFSSSDDSVPRKVKKDDQEWTEYWWVRKVEAEVVYKVVDARTRAIIDYQSWTLTGTSSEIRDRYELPAPETLIKYQTSNLVDRIMKQIQPWKETLWITLLADEAKDPAMEEADRLVKDGYTAEARAKFAEIRDRTGNFAAGYNAAILLLALDKADEARAEMQALSDKFHDPRARDGLAFIDREIASRKKLQAQQER